jgi:uncharacterized membrane protein
MMRHMSGATLLFLTVRVLHVLLAALWLGGTAFIVFFVMPALEKTGTAAAPMMGAMARRGINPFMNAVGGITTLAGFWLYWHLTGGFQPALSGTMAARVFGAGGVAGLLAVIIGGALVARSGRKMGEFGGKALSLPEGSERKSLMAQSDAMRLRATRWGRVMLVLQIIALVLMAIGHYV